MEEYQRKRTQLLRGGVHVVEIDLVRRGEWRRLGALLVQFPWSFRYGPQGPVLRQLRTVSLTVMVPSLP